VGLTAGLVFTAGFSIFRIFGDSTHLLTKESLRGEQVSCGYDGTSVVFELELLSLPLVVPEDEIHLSISVGFRAQIWEKFARVKENGELKTLS
jgi:hypothetical protein